MMVGFVRLRDLNDRFQCQSVLFCCEISKMVGFVPLFFYEISMTSVLFSYEISKTVGLVLLQDLNDGWFCFFVLLRDFKDSRFCLVMRF